MRHSDQNWVSNDQNSEVTSKPNQPGHWQSASVSKVMKAQKIFKICDFYLYINCFCIDFLPFDSFETSRSLPSFCDLFIETKFETIWPIIDKKRPKIWDQLKPKLMRPTSLLKVMKAQKIFKICDFCLFLNCFCITFLSFDSFETFRSLPFFSALFIETKFESIWLKLDEKRPKTWDHLKTKLTHAA